MSVQAPQEAVMSAQLRDARPRRGRTTAILLGHVVLILIVLLVWQCVALLSSGLVPTVGPTFAALVAEFGDNNVLEPLWSTLRAVLGGFLIGAAVGLPAGVLLGRSAYLRKTFDPLISAVFSIPRILIYPAMLAYFGIGVQSKLALAAVAGFFPVLITTIAAVASIRPILTHVARTLGCSPVQTVVKVYLPAAAAPIVAALRVGFSVSFVTVVSAEMFVADTGLGHELLNAYGTQQTERMFALMVLALVIAMGVSTLLWRIERWITSATS